MGSDYQLSDALGKTWTLDEKGEVTFVGEKADTKLAQNQEKNNLPKGQPKPENFDVKWDFSQSAFAFDASGEIPYKALVKGKNDVFQVVIKQKDTLQYSFHFQTDKGLKVESKKEKEGIFEISRKGLFDFGDEELWVVAKNAKTEKEEVIGKCMLVHLSEKEVNVTLIPTAKDLQINIDEIQRIYAKVGVKLHISTDEIFPVEEIIDTGNAFGDLSTYSPEQQGVITLYKSQRTIKSDTYYVFVGKQEGLQAGYMRLGSQFGFVMDGKERTIAHELGHGIFKLEHPFKKDKTKKGTFRTLMDYAQETTFAYTDWKQINDPKLKVYAFQGQSQGEIANKVWLTPDWKPFKVDDSKTIRIIGGYPKGIVPAKVPYLENLKSSGTIPKQIAQDQTYFSLDRIDNPMEAIDKMQLNGKLTDAVWRLEFDVTQIVGKVKFPKAKWNNAEYIEVLTRSYPNFGSGGASQFITQSEIKLTRMVNLKTAEIINFK